MKYFLSLLVALWGLVACAQQPQPFPRSFLQKIPQLDELFPHGRYYVGVQLTDGDRKRQFVFLKNADLYSALRERFANYNQYADTLARVLDRNETLFVSSTNTLWKQATQLDRKTCEKQLSRKVLQMLFDKDWNFKGYIYEPEIASSQTKQRLMTLFQRGYIFISEHDTENFRVLDYTKTRFPIPSVPRDSV